MTLQYNYSTRLKREKCIITLQLKHSTYISIMPSLHDSFWSLILPRALTIMEDWVGRQLHYEMIVGLNMFLSYVECWILSNMESCLSVHHVTLLVD